ncbi:hypothetical protein P8C59_007224 [Phyllachora maydis]|uniref:Zn(2)-C6 fungal-type domain-containing protein n=1 Tax=Phyllachora maydis TaxID=1825666 RepID=A0AAD9I8F8_9PEZI|nr:hypothetical protein P8C59_007224 [Phyllachora maydis]
MAVAQAAKVRPASKAGSNAGSSNVAPKQKTQMHRRSRTGCYTCRLRRKKCDEGTPMCSACKHLGLGCEYKRPMWWGNNELRRKHKDDIKTIIKRKKLSEKAAHTMQTTVGSPPGLSHSLPTSATFSDPPLDRTRSQSIDSHFSGFNFNSPGSSHEYTVPFATPQIQPDFVFPPFSPYEIDVKTERQMYVNDVPTLRESTTSTYYTTPPPPGTLLPSFPVGGEWTEQVYLERRESLMTEGSLMTDDSFGTDLSAGLFEMPHGLPPVDPSDLGLDLDQGDRRFLDHFVQYVAPTLFPILESNHQGSASADLILPALQNNKAYLHCCLGTAAQHYKTATAMQGEEIDGEIMRHRYATISSLCGALAQDENHQQIVEAALGLIYFQCRVGRFDDALPDIAWHQHFQAMIGPVHKLDLPRLVADPDQVPGQTPFSMTLTAWIDILGATMQGRAPTFAHTYREKHLSLTNPSLGLRELMGCEDRVMYLISEMACLEALKADGMDDITLCQHVQVLGDQMGLTEMGEAAALGLDVPPSPAPPYLADGSLSADQLARNVTAAFRLAARVYLCSLVPGFSPRQASCIGLVDRLAAVLALVPGGPGGYDGSLAWVYLVGGAASGPTAPLRALLDERAAQLGEEAHHGSFGRMKAVLREVWAQNDRLWEQQQQQQQQQKQEEPASASAVSSPGVSEAPQAFVHWRDVMRMKELDFLLI